jgi:hypothetical protein
MVVRLLLLGFGNGVEPPMVVQTMVVGNEVESLMVERMQLGNLDLMVQPMVVRMLLLRCGREVELLLRLGKGMESPIVVQTMMVRLQLGNVLMVELLLLRLGKGVMPPMVVHTIVVRLLLHHRGILGDAIWVLAPSIQRCKICPCPLGRSRDTRSCPRQV